MSQYVVELASSEPTQEAANSPPLDVVAAQLAATRYAGDILRDDPHRLWERGLLRIEVKDEHGLLQSAVVVLAVDTA